MLVIWYERAMALREMRSGERPVMSSPSKTIRPPVGRSTPVRQLKKVDFPAPLGPMTARIWPRGTATLTLSRALSPPNCMLRPSVRRMMDASGPRPSAARAIRAACSLTLCELAGGRDDGLFLGDDLQDLVLAPADLEDELAGEGLVVFPPEGLVALGEVVALLHVQPLERLDELGGILAALEAGLLHADLEG